MGSLNQKQRCDCWNRNQVIRRHNFLTTLLLVDIRQRKGNDYDLTILQALAQHQCFAGSAGSLGRLMRRFIFRRLLNGFSFYKRWPGIQVVCV